MNRTGLLVATAVAVLVGLVFGLYPKLDILLEAQFFDPARGGFWARVNPIFNGIRDFARVTVTLLVAPAVIAILVKLFRPRRPMLIPGRAAVFLVTTLALGPGLVTNAILKNHWHRPRPIDVAEFSGRRPFMPWWDPRGGCPENCSFVAGEPSGALWTFAPAALAPPAWRPLAYAGAITFGAVIGFERMIAGGHFFSDVAFAGVFTFLIVWLAHGLLYRWLGRRITDRTVERLLERPALLLRGGRTPVAPPGEAVASAEAVGGSEAVRRSE